jgi:hypothetical protein
MIFIAIVYTVQNSLCGRKIREKSDELLHEMDEMIYGKDEKGRCLLFHYMKILSKRFGTIQKTNTYIYMHEDLILILELSLSRNRNTGEMI